MTELLWQIGLALCLGIGVLATFIRLPGTWIIVAATIGYSWQFSWSVPSSTVLIMLVGLAVAAEVVELITGALFARRAGASRRAGIAALIGGFVGMFVFSLPLPIIGTIFGGIAGCFVGAALAEMTIRRNVHDGARVGFFAAVGQVVGMVAKSLVAIIMAGLAMISVIL